MFDPFKNYPNVDAQVPNKNDKLHMAIQLAAYDDGQAFIKTLVEVEGVKPSFSDCQAAIENNNTELLDYLLSHGADPHEDDDLLIHVAAGINRIAALKVLAKHGADNYTPILNDFIYTKQTKAAIYMLENGAEPNTQTLEQAAKIDDLTILKHLVAVNGMVPSKEFIDTLPALFSEAKHFLSKALLQEKLHTKLKPTTPTMRMKI